MQSPQSGKCVVQCSISMLEVQCVSLISLPAIPSQMDESSECITIRVIEISKRTKLSDDHIQNMMRANSGAFSQHAGASGNGDKGINTTLTNDEWLDYTFIDRDGTLELLQDVMMDETQTNVLEEATDANLSQYTNNVGGETARGNSKGLESDCKKMAIIPTIKTRKISANIMKESGELVDEANVQLEENHQNDVDLLEDQREEIRNEYTHDIGCLEECQCRDKHEKRIEAHAETILELREVIAKHIKAAEGAAMASEKEAKKVKEEHTKEYNELMDLYNKDQKQLQLERDLRSKAEKNAQDEGARRVASEANTNYIYDYLVLQE